MCITEDVGLAVNMSLRVEYRESIVRVCGACRYSGSVSSGGGRGDLDGAR